MQEKIFIKDLVADTFIDSPFLLESLQVKKKKNGEDYLGITLKDKTGEAHGVMWDNVAETLDSVSQGDYVQATAKVSTYNDKIQLTLQRLSPLDAGQVDESDFVPSSEKDLALLWNDFMERVNGIGHLQLRRLILEIFDDDDFASRFRKAPAAKGYHHTYLGGLLEHTLSIVQLCEMIADHYPHLDKDLLVVGGIIHDLAKVNELSYERNFDYTDEGRLLGHIVMGTVDLDGRMRRLEFPDKLRIKVLHMLISHHGEEQYGSPKKPMTPEAIALHFIDMIDSRMEMVRFSLENEKDLEGSFTSYNRGLECFLYKG
jgi:3'-5' exoribonuclease